MRSTINLPTVPRELHHKVRLNQGFKSDLEWWECFLPSWNRVGMMAGVTQTRVAASMTSDASGSWSIHIIRGVVSTPVAPIMATSPHHSEGAPSDSTWRSSVGQAMAGQYSSVLVRQSTVVAVIKSGRSKDERVMQLMRRLFLFLASGNITLLGGHIQYQGLTMGQRMRCRVIDHVYSWHRYQQLADLPQPSPKNWWRHWWSAS